VYSQRSQRYPTRGPHTHRPAMVAIARRTRQPRMRRRKKLAKSLSRILSYLTYWLPPRPTRGQRTCFTSAAETWESRGRFRPMPIRSSDCPRVFRSRDGFHAHILGRNRHPSTHRCNPRSVRVRSGRRTHKGRRGGSNAATSQHESSKDSPRRPLQHCQCHSSPQGVM
jgi:hypothetical protein